MPKLSSVMPRKKQSRASHADKWQNSDSQRNECAGGRHQAGSGSSRHEHQRTRRGKCWEGLRNERHSHDQGSVSRHKADDTDSPDIPGFFYDKEKKRYFKILPNHSSVSGQVTNDVIKQAFVEKQRQKDLTHFKIGSNKLAHHSAHIPVRSVLRSANLCDVLMNSTMGHHCPALSRTVLHKSVVRQLLPKATEPVVDNDSVDPGGNIEDIKFMLLSKDSQNVIGVWTRYDMLGHRIHHTQIEPVKKADSDGTVKLGLCKRRFLCTLTQNGVSSCCWAPASSSDNTTRILSTATSFFGNRNSFVRIWDYAGVTSEQFFDMGRHMLWSCAWSADACQFSVGTDTASLLVELGTRRRWELHPDNSPVHAQVFSQNGQQLFSGNKLGKVYVHDLRSRSTMPVTTLKHKIGLAHLYHSTDENCLVASDVSGQIKKWDLRSCRVVQRYKGHMNKYVRQPFHVDPEERILCAVGEDCYTRLWCFRTGELLATIPPPHRASVDSIPAVIYSPQLGGRGGLPALLMATQANFHVYTL